MSPFVHLDVSVQLNRNDAVLHALVADSADSAGDSISVLSWFRFVKNANLKLFSETYVLHIFSTAL
jgi:hypothetical protein